MKVILIISRFIKLILADVCRYILIPTVVILFFYFVGSIAVFMFAGFTANTIMGLNVLDVLVYAANCPDSPGIAMIFSMGFVIVSGIFCAVWLLIILLCILKDELFNYLSDLSIKSKTKMKG